MKIGIIGYGYVGQHTESILSGMHDLVVYDPATHPEYQTGLDVAVICVPTPMAADGTCDTSIVEAEAARTDAPIIVVRSTIEPGTCDRIARTTGKQVVFLPEFIVARTGEDFAAGYWVVGGECPAGLLPEREFVIELPLIEAEAVKYLANTYFALKVVFAYEFAALCQKAGIDYRRVLDAAVADPRIDRDHLEIMGMPGAGGHCLPKDLSALVEFGKRMGLGMELLSAARANNDRLLGLDSLAAHATPEFHCAPV